MERMAENRTFRKIAWKTSEYKKKRGRPRKRWRETVLEDLKDKGVADWKRKAMYRKNWKRITMLWDCLKAS